MSDNKIKVVFRGSRARVFTPDGTELRHVISAKVKTDPGSVAALVLELADFEIDSQVKVDSPTPAELARFGLRPEDIKGGV